MRTAEPGIVTRAIMRAVALLILVSLKLCWDAPQAATQLVWANEGDEKAASAATESANNPSFARMSTSKKTNTKGTKNRLKVTKALCASAFAPLGFGGTCRAAFVIFVFPFRPFFSSPARERPGSSR